MLIHPDFPYLLYLVITEENCTYLPWLQVAEQAIKGGVDIIQLREKKISKQIFLKKAIALKNLCDRYSIPLIINDHVDIAAKIDAWGVHVGQTDMAPLHIKEQYADRFKIGWSLEANDQLLSDNMLAVDHLGVSPIFSTATKTDTITEWGIQGIKKLRKETELPLIAIGNMNITNVQRVINAGASSIAVVSAICSNPDPQSVSQKIKELLINNVYKDEP